jgi:hypothetical protein
MSRAFLALALVMLISEATASTMTPRDRSTAAATTTTPRDQSKPTPTPRPVDTAMQALYPPIDCNPAFCSFARPSRDETIVAKTPVIVPKIKIAPKIVESNDDPYWAAWHYVNDLQLCVDRYLGPRWSERDGMRKHDACVKEAQYRYRERMRAVVDTRDWEW